MTPIYTPSQTAFSTVPQWQPATWEDYLNYRDTPTTERVRLFFNASYLFVDMGSEGLTTPASITYLPCCLLFGLLALDRLLAL